MPGAQVVDLEKQQDVGRSRALRNTLTNTIATSITTTLANTLTSTSITTAITTDPLDEPRLGALRTLFDFSAEQMQQVRELSTSSAWCRHVEDCFQPLLTEQYAGVWPALDLPTPLAASHCWALFRAVCSTVGRVGDDGYSIEEIWRLLATAPAADAAADLTAGAAAAAGEEAGPDHGTQGIMAVFAVLCWGTMLLQPKLTWSDPTVAACLAVHELPAKRDTLKMSFVRRPIPAVFRGFRTALARHRLPPRPAAHDAAVLFVSTINYHSLRTIGKVRLQWVDSMSCHLKFDSRTRSLSLFRFPTFCALTAIAGGQGALFDEVVRAVFSADDEGDRELDGSLQLSQEILMSYRLLFGQSHASRGLGKTLLREMEGQADYDRLLVGLCTQPRSSGVVKKLPNSFWPVSCRTFDDNLQELDSYTLHDDFPMLGSRLAALQEFNLRQQPSKLRDLWRDRRNPLQWYTFWAVLVVGGLSILLGILQLAVAVVALAQSIHPLVSP
ncbi:MAG: hypothetical protein M1829_005242 [Trizodia sp. TS-e1964]|nr:MAG: hypothetical protein M1829_005242 [Trizodia sp. TS-e1964]